MSSGCARAQCRPRLERLGFILVLAALVLDRHNCARGHVRHPHLPGEESKSGADLLAQARRRRKQRKERAEGRAQAAAAPERARRAVGAIDVLPPGAAAPVRVYPNVLVPNRHVHLRRLREDRHRGSRGVNPPLGLGERHPLHLRGNQKRWQRRVAAAEQRRQVDAAGGGC